MNNDKFYTYLTIYQVNSQKKLFSLNYIYQNHENNPSLTFPDLGHIEPHIELTKYIIVATDPSSNVW